MSSGSQIGGIVGGVIGFVGTGFNPTGFKVGYMIGSAIGGYVDPVQVKGPRITDAQAMTATVGGVITDGYGTFTTLTNVIFCSELEEKASRSRGKGGGTKTTTYQYYRSYGIGVCIGPVDGIKWIKRNSKKVYTTDPNATAEEKQYSAKFAKKLRIYYGTRDQMPDPIESQVCGADNVSAHRGLCWFSVERDELTDAGGMVPTYEVCVIKNGLAFHTSPPYTLHFKDAMRPAVRPTGITKKRERWDEGFSDAMAPGMVIGDIAIRPIVIPLEFGDTATAAMSIGDIEIKPVVLDGDFDDAMTAVLEIGDIAVEPYVLHNDSPHDTMSVGISIGDIEKL